MRNLNDLRYPHCQDIELMKDTTCWDALEEAADNISLIRETLDICKENCSLGRAAKIAPYIKTWQREAENLLGFQL